jgi:NADH:ubiquinone reductase (non-electrogenic)
VAEEPIRRLSNSKNMTKYQVHVSAIDLEKKRISCLPAVRLGGEDEGTGKGFEVKYDKLILAPGSETNTFGTPDVVENCYTLKTIADARRLRERILDCFELASLPNLSSSQKRDILHFVIIGGGPTGVELAAELDEPVHQHLVKVYKHLEGICKISVYDVADTLLGMFGERLSEYAMERFKRREGVNVCMGRHIEGFERGMMKVKEDGEVGFGVAVWCAGNKACGLVEGLDVRKSEGGMERVMTDRFLRVLQKGKESGDEVVDGAYALGDAADIEGHELPATAEVAVQKAEWLAKYFIAGEEGKPFEYKQKALVAYIGRQDGVVEGKQDWTGASAWLAWRSGNLEWTRSWRRKAMMVLYWVMNKLDGREVARR